jgi:hypothetical protein
MTGTTYQIVAILLGPFAGLAIALLLYWLVGPNKAT